MAKLTDEERARRDLLKTVRTADRALARAEAALLAKRAAFKAAIKAAHDGGNSWTQVAEYSRYDRTHLQQMTTGKSRDKKGVAA